MLILDLTYIFRPHFYWFCPHNLKQQLYNNDLS